MAKISIVLHDLRGGGAEKMMVRLANQLSENGDSVEMILITGGGSNKAFLSKTVKLTELNCKRTLDAFGPLRNALKQSGPDGILAALTHINVITSMVCWSLGWSKKLSVSERNAFSLDKKVNTNKVMKTAYFLAPYIYRLLPNPVIAVSQGVADDLIDTTVVRHKDVVIAPNPVVTREIIEASHSAPTHSWLLDKQLPTIVTAGRLSHQKGFDLLLDAFYKVQQKVACRLIIYGEGELREKLENQARSLNLADKVSMPGYTQNPIAEMKAADLYVLSSRFEGSPNALVEAMAVGTPVIAFDCPHGAREILQGGAVAPLIDYLNVEDLATTIVVAVQSPLRQDYRPFVSKFTSANSAQIYRQLLLNEN